MSDLAQNAILVTVVAGTVDYVTSGNARVVVVDFDSLDPETAFPEDFDVIIQQVIDLPQTISWRGSVIRRLNELKSACKRELHTGN